MSWWDSDEQGKFPTLFNNSNNHNQYQYILLSSFNVPITLQSKSLGSSLFRKGTIKPVGYDALWLWQLTFTEFLLCEGIIPVILHESLHLILIIILWSSSITSDIL